MVGERSGRGTAGRREACWSMDHRLLDSGLRLRACLLTLVSHHILGEYPDQSGSQRQPIRSCQGVQQLGRPLCGIHPAGMAHRHPDTETRRRRDMEAEGDVETQGEMDGY
ncbi:unnamed protein product [Arctogadus glacialis]